MKRLATIVGLALAALLGVFAISAPAHASTVTCTTPTTSGTNTYPMNYLWICNGTGTVTTGDVNASNGALGHLGGVNVGSNSDAKTKMASNNHYIYVFANDADFNGSNAYCTTNGNKTSNPPVLACTTLPTGAVAGTYTVDGGTTWQTVIIESRINNQSPVVYTTVANTAAHEAGHHLDTLYGASLYGAGHLASEEGQEFAFKLAGMKDTFTGTITAGDTLSLTFQGTQISGTVTIIHNVISGDTLTSIASDFASKINANGSLSSSTINAHATSSGAVLSVTSHAILTYGKSSTGTGGHAATETITQSLYDWPAFDTLIACAQNTGIFSQQQDHTGTYICSSFAQGTVSGTVHAGDVVGITVTDTNLGANNPHSVGYVVQSGDTATTIATGLAARINGDAILRAAGITATSSSNKVNISSGTNASSYAASLSIGATETLTGLGTVTAGNGNTRSNSYSSNTTNDAMLQQAWPHYFTNSDAALWAELFAGETAIVAGQTAPNNATQDHYLGSGNYICSKNFVNAVEKTGSVPSTTNFPYSSNCK